MKLEINRGSNTTKATMLLTMMMMIVSIFSIIIIIMCSIRGSLMKINPHDGIYGKVNTKILHFFVQPACLLPAQSIPLHWLDGHR